MISARLYISKWLDSNIQYFGISIAAYIGQYAAPYTHHSLTYYSFLKGNEHKKLKRLLWYIRFDYHISFRKSGYKFFR